ncbi:MAG: hypothetical protein IT514_01595 [Burkholderiales bacterium]|nr:hypothetical protein [Burkholderiales bacterium]
MVSMVTSYPFVLTVPATSPVRTVAELIALAKANPGKLNYSGSGVGSVHHLASELFNSMAGTEIVHVPMKGGAGELTELMAGRLDVLFEATTLTIPCIKSGKIRAVAITSRDRTSLLPGVAPVHDALPGFDVISFSGLGVTGGTPAASSAEEMKFFVEREIAKWNRMVDSRGIERQQLRSRRRLGHEKRGAARPSPCLDFRESCAFPPACAPGCRLQATDTHCCN